jgi:hypothetical protein
MPCPEITWSTSVRGRTAGQPLACGDRVWRPVVAASSSARLPTGQRQPAGTGWRRGNRSATPSSPARRSPQQIGAGSRPAGWVPGAVGRGPAAGRNLANVPGRGQPSSTSHPHGCGPAPRCAAGAFGRPHATAEPALADRLAGKVVQEASGADAQPGLARPGALAPTSMEVPPTPAGGPLVAAGWPTGSSSLRR